MKNSIIYISLFIALWGLCSCSMEEQYAPVSNESTIQLVPRITSFNGVDVATKADGDAPAFETAIYNAYLLIFDNKGNRVHFSSVAEENGSWSQKVTMKNLPSGTACFIANVPQDFAGGIDTIDELNNAVLDLTYATYTEAGGYLGVPKLTVNGESKLCIPMFGSTPVGTMTHNQTLSIPVKRLFAKISVELKLDIALTFDSEWIEEYIARTNYQLNEWKLHNLPNKVRLVEYNTSESAWKDGKDNPNITTPFQSPTISAKIYNSGSNGSGDKAYSFECYVPEFYLNSINSPTADQRYKPKNYPDGTFPIYLELVGQYNAYSVTSTDINYKVYLGSDNVSNFSLSRNTHYKNFLTIKGTDNNDKAEVADNLDHRVTTSTINNPVARAGKSANCYVINATGEYNFPAYKGAYNDLAEAVLCNNQTANEIVILANDNSSNIELSNYTYDPERNLISFNVSKIANGNVVLGLMNKDGSIEWSWHLWCNTDSQLDFFGWGAMSTQTYPSGAELMDRNLGAQEAAITLLNQNNVIGLYYRYGCKEPFIDGAYRGGGTLTDSQGQTITPSWSAAKSPTDPCPPGYKVPSSAVWSQQGSHSSALGAYIYASLSTIDNINFPYAGYINSNGTKQDEVSSYSFDVVITEEFKGIANKFKNVRYTLSKNADFGVLSTISNQSYQRYLGALMSLSELSNLTPTSCDISKNSWGTWSEYETRTLTRSELNSLKTLMVFSGETNIASFEQDFVANNQNGYQVRCVMEKEE